MELPPLMPCSAYSWPSPPFSQLCLCRVAKVVWIAGWVWSKPPAKFLFHGVTAGWDGGTGAPSEAGLSHPLAFSAGFLWSGNSSGGEGPRLAGGQQTRSWPMAFSPDSPTGSLAHSPILGALWVIYQVGRGSLAVQWLGLGAFIAVSGVQSLFRETKI